MRLCCGVTQHKAISTFLNAFIIKVAASSADVGKQPVETPLLKTIPSITSACLAFRLDIIEHWTKDLLGPGQYINQTCYLLPG